MELFKYLSQDVRFVEGLKSCMNCGICTAICPAAEFYDYDPRVILNIMQTKDNDEIEHLLKSEKIWLCGQCMSCKTRCPRGNCPGQVISVLRKASQEFGYFTETRIGLQQYALYKVIGLNILKYGYCIHPTSVVPELHPEQGPVWEWIYNNMADVYERTGANLDKDGEGGLRKISEETLNELKLIFDETGATELYEKIKNLSHTKAKELGFKDVENDDTEFFNYVYFEK